MNTMTTMLAMLIALIVVSLGRWLTHPIVRPPWTVRYSMRRNGGDWEDGEYVTEGPLITLPKVPDGESADYGNVFVDGVVRDRLHRLLNGEFVWH